MKQSKLLIHTYREMPRDADVPSRGWPTDPSLYSAYRLTDELISRQNKLSGLRVIGRASRMH